MAGGASGRGAVAMKTSLSHVDGAVEGWQDAPSRDAAPAGDAPSVAAARPGTQEGSAGWCEWRRAGVG